MIAETLPAGEYWIGDPCYAFPNSGPKEHLWCQVLGDSHDLDDPYITDEIKIWAGGTAYGDGEYESDTNDIFPVDAGLIGIMTRETVDFLSNDITELTRLGKFVTFNEDFNICINYGTFQFGDMVIETGVDIDGFYDDYDNDYYDD